MTDGGKAGVGGRAAPEIELAAASGRAPGRGVGNLGPLLGWAVVFADLGSSVFYVPAILYAQVGALAPAFVVVATVAFVFVALEHLEVAHRYPKGGGGVAAAVEAFGPRVGVVSGALMVSAYLVTISISVVSALQYIAVLRPWPHEIEILSALAIAGLGFLHLIGVRELARLALLLGLATLAVEGVLVASVVAQLGPADWADLLAHLRFPKVGWSQGASGFAAAWLAYSGLESLGQLAPAVREPRRRVIRITVALVVGSMVVTVPLFTALAVEAAEASHFRPQPALLAPVALAYGGRKLLVALSLCGAGFLLVAANVAFIGCYNVFKAVSEHGYLPAVMTQRGKRFGTPRFAIVVITLASLILVLATGASLLRLGRVFAFGLLGSYTITSVSLMVLRWRERRLGLGFVVGLVATAALVVPWVTSWFSKPVATLYGAGVTGLQLAVAFVTHRGWIRSGRFGFIRAAAAERAAAAAHPSATEVVTLDEALSLRQTYPSTTLVALRGPNRNLCREAVRRARGVGDGAVYVVFVDEIPGLFFPPRTGPSDEALDVLDAAVSDIGKEGMQAVPIWRLAHDAGASIAEAAEELGVRCVLMGTTARSTVWQFLRGDVLKQLIAELPEPIHVVICE
jgi:amino acid transporter